MLIHEDVSRGIDRYRFSFREFLFQGELCAFAFATGEPLDRSVTPVEDVGVAGGVERDPIGFDEGPCGGARELP